MTPAQKNLVQSTWSKVVPIADTAAKMFYDRLFEIDPSTRPLFRSTDLAEQRRKLLQVLSAAIAGLDKLEDLVPIVETLGRKHAGYGVKDAHYDSVGAALLWTLEQGLGAAWNGETAAAWTEVYGILAGVMRRAQKDALAEAMA
jgi:hemoglobin-like flavoprotein